MEPTTPDAIEPPANVLFVHAGPTDSTTCEQLRTVDLEGDLAELTVSFSSANVETDRSYSNGRPSKLGLVSIGDVLQSGSSGEPDFTGPMTTDVVDDPGDLSAIGLSVSQFCEHWGDGDEQLVVCFHSLDAALRHSSPKAVFQFTYVLLNRFSSVGAHAHVHFDPTAFDDRTVATFSSLFDAVVCDDSVQGSLPEATDDEVAAVLETWSDADEAGDGDVPLTETIQPASEATDDDIARILGQ
ncbi:DUF7504 family protein [Natronobiforma cellulositropha]|uniref:DUF7504 family protein n=1 Tax=Natronobiforma cellulositropha TaxID=1679076 RepID=UPI0021D5A20F|nr:hypothetical protein [Natronobiforma cellulositropha]